MQRLLPIAVWGHIAAYEQEAGVHSPERLLSSYEISNVMTHSERKAVALNALPNVTNQPGADIRL